MKVLTIGRDMTCDIVLNDTTDHISRRHAMLNIYPTGKMTLIDMSHNGTFVNGMKIPINTPYPVTRKDDVAFANVMHLDWRQVPNQKAKVMGIVFGAIAALIVLAGLLWFLSRPEKPKTQEPQTAPTEQVQEPKADAPAVVPAPDTAIKNDSVPAAPNDSLSKGGENDKENGSESEADKKEETQKSDGKAEQKQQQTTKPADNKKAEQKKTDSKKADNKQPANQGKQDKAKDKTKNNKQKQDSKDTKDNNSKDTKDKKDKHNRFV